MSYEALIEELIAKKQAKILAKHNKKPLPTRITPLSGSVEESRRSRYKGHKARKTQRVRKNQRGSHIFCEFEDERDVNLNDTIPAQNRRHTGQLIPIPHYEAVKIEFNEPIKAKIVALDPARYDDIDI